MRYAITSTQGRSALGMIARLEVGEEILTGLKGLARTAAIPSASLSGLGAVSDVTLALYDPAARAYRETRLEEDLEIVSMVGNIAWLGAEPVVHLHGVVSRADCTTAAGHIMRGIVSVTVEVMLTVFPERIERRADPAVGLNLLDLGSSLT